MAFDRVDTGAMTTTARRVGYIGLGNLGFHLAHSLLKAGHQLTITDLSKDLAEPLLAKGATWATSAKEVAERSDVVFTCLPSPKVIDTVVLGENGILAGSHDGMIWIDNSTNDQEETIRLAALCAAKGVRMLESPVTGGVHKAAAGDITVLVGGDEATFGDEEAGRAVETGHSTAREAADVAARAGARRLVLTHFSARYSSDPSDLLRESKGKVARALLGEFTARRPDDRFALIVFSTLPMRVV